MYFNTSFPAGGAIHSSSGTPGVGSMADREEPLGTFPSEMGGGFLRSPLPKECWKLMVGGKREIFSASGFVIHNTGETWGKYHNISH